MIFGTGVDIIEIERIRHSLEKYASQFQNKVFTTSEIEYCSAKADPARHFAARFAVKEAVSKCLGTGIGETLGWKDIETTNDHAGKPVLHLNGKGQELFDRLKLKAVHISISHGQTYAVAQAIAERSSQETS